MKNTLRPPSRPYLFISKATPEDNSFAAWLAPRLEALGYSVFADILDLRGGQKWRQVLTETLRDKSVKMLLCASDVSLQKSGVMEEIEIAMSVSRELNDPEFIIPLRLAPYPAVFGLTTLQYIDFSKSWADGLVSLKGDLATRDLPKADTTLIDARWGAALCEGHVELVDETENLTSNWLRVEQLPDNITLISPRRYADAQFLARLMKKFDYPTVEHRPGWLIFGSEADIQDHLGENAGMVICDSCKTEAFFEDGYEDWNMWRGQARKTIVNLIRQGWEHTCRRAGLSSYTFSNALAFHANDEIAALNRRISWGRQGEKRSNALRNRTKRGLWEYGLSAKPSTFPFLHIRLKNRVIFSDPGDASTGVYTDTDKQHRLRRSVCSTWRNRRWYGLMMAMLETLSGDSAYITLRFGDEIEGYIDAMPIKMTSPVTTPPRIILGEDGEETDLSTLAGFGVS